MLTNCIVIEELTVTKRLSTRPVFNICCCISTIKVNKQNCISVTLEDALLRSKCIGITCICRNSQFINVSIEIVTICNSTTNSNWFCGTIVVSINIVACTIQNTIYIYFSGSRRSDKCNMIPSICSKSCITTPNN